jgi:chromosome partitioning protein
MRIIALANQKGGVGKTTSAASIGGSLAMRGRRVLLVDVDPQANLSIHVGVDIHVDQPSMYPLMVGEAKVEEAIQHTRVQNLDIIASDIDLAGAEVELVGMVGRETVLKEALSPIIDRYDYIFLDCPPSLGLLTLNAFTTAKELFIPMQAEFFALHGMSKLLETVSIVKRRLNAELEITGIITCMFDSRTNLSREVLDNIRTYFGDKVFKTVIRKNVRLAESPSYGKVIMEYDPLSAGAHDYSALADEVVAQEPRHGLPGPEPAPFPDVPAVPAVTVMPASAAASEAQVPAAAEQAPAEPAQETATTAVMEAPASAGGEQSASQNSQPPIPKAAEAQPSGANNE